MSGAEVTALAASVKFMGRTFRGTLEETHISWVILTPQFAFKIKKPLKLSFLDFSSLAWRKKQCEREVLLNSRFSTVYLAVIPVRYTDSGFMLGGQEGDIVDYAVQMKRMRSSLRMDLFLKGGKVNRTHILSLAKCISTFHRGAPVVSKVFDPSSQKEAFNDIRVARSFIEENLGRRYSSILARSMLWSNAFLRTHLKRFHERVSSGYKRDLHGDLHSGNIFLYKRPVIFDCIEFNDTYRQIDVIDEIAFFCMDLEVYGEKALSDFFVTEYTRRFACFQSREDQEMFRYFKCYRANVRAKVKVMAASRQEESVQGGPELGAIRKYLLLMEEYIS